jgi:hypothetical protein
MWAIATLLALALSALAGWWVVKPQASTPTR